MAYIIKNTSGLINTRLTDVGRRNISQGNFNISYFQIGDSEVSYSAVTNYNITNNNILMPAFNAQNDTGTPRSNKQNIKYPYYVQGNQGNTYGIPFLDSQFQSVYNSAGVKGFFTTGGTQASTYSVNVGDILVFDFSTLLPNVTCTGQGVTCVDLTFQLLRNNVQVYTDDIHSCIPSNNSLTYTYTVPSGTSSLTVDIDSTVS